jgi:ABC-type sugar transport system ATPase subunit
LTSVDRLLELRGVTKTYPGVTANKDVSLTLDSGQVKALLGENGAGKSTLIKVIMGIVQPEAGIMEVGGQTISWEGHNPGNASRLGIFTVFQELSLIPSLSIAENIFLKTERTQWGFIINRKEMFEKTASLLEEYQIQMDPRIPVSSLPQAKRQLIEIIKAVSGKPRILILDEPTSALTSKETEKLYKIIHQLQSGGTGIIYITHRLNEVNQVANSVMVLRDGRNVAELESKDIRVETIVSHMVGRDMDLYSTREKKKYSDLDIPALLELDDIAGNVEDAGISLKLYPGEILGLAGLEGSGRSELVEKIFGIHPYRKGRIKVNQKPLVIKNVRTAMDAGIALVPESRHIQGLNLQLGVDENIILPILKQFTLTGFLLRKRIALWADEWIQKLAIKTENRNKIVNSLSGGNQQKVVIAKWLGTRPQVLILDEVTAGIDVGSKSEIHRKIHALADEGMGIILISSDMPELLALSDRIMVLNHDRIIASFFGLVTQEQIMEAIVRDNMKENTTNERSV